MIESIPEDWRALLADTVATPSFADLEAFVARERADRQVYPAPGDVFAALRLTPYASVRAVIIGQDPYHQPGQAHGLAFSAPPGAKRPPSLRNILAELDPDQQPQLGSGCLELWARHGVLLLNTVLTVRRDEPGSHAGHGWEAFTDSVVRLVDRKPGPVVFLLWGARAHTMTGHIDPLRHVVMQASHPSPLSARLGFRGSAPFRRANEELVRRGVPPIDWDLSAT